MGCYISYRTFGAQNILFHHIQTVAASHLKQVPLTSVELWQFAVRSYKVFQKPLPQNGRVGLEEHIMSLSHVVTKYKPFKQCQILDEGQQSETGITQRFSSAQLSSILHWWSGVVLLEVHTGWLLSSDFKAAYLHFIKVDVCSHFCAIENRCHPYTEHRPKAPEAQHCLFLRDIASQDVLCLAYLLDANMQGIGEYRVHTSYH